MIYKGKCVNMDKINVRGVKVDNVTMNEASERAFKAFEGKYSTPFVIFTPNAEIIQDCIENPPLFDIINSASMIIPDGAGVVLASKILKTPLKEKVAGSDLSFILMEKLNQMGGRLFLLGSKQEIVENAAANLTEKYKNLIICGYNNGFFDVNGVESNVIIEKINASSPDALFVCFGAPKTEKWIHKNKDRLNAKLIIGLGGMIDNYAGAVKRAPRIMIKMNLEWLYRLIKQPWRLHRMMKIPKFLFGCVKQSGATKL